MPQAAIENIPEMAVCGFSFSKTVGKKNKRKKINFQAVSIKTKQLVLTEKTLLSSEATNTFMGHLLLSS